MLNMVQVSYHQPLLPWLLLQRSQFFSHGCLGPCKNKIKIINHFIYFLLSGLIIPFQVVMFPLVALFRNINEIFGIKMLRTYHGMILAYIGFGAPLAVFMFHGFIKSIPKELEEAATIDGCSKPQIFFLIIMPILKPIFCNSHYLKCYLDLE